MSNKKKWYQYVGVQAAFILAIGWIIVAGMNILYNHTQLVQNNQQYERDIVALEKSLRNKDSEILRLETQLTPFKTIALEKYTGSEQERLQKLAQDVERLKRAVAPRQLTDGQRRKIISILSPFAGASITVGRRGELEAYNYANQIVEALQAAGLNVKVSGGLGGTSAPEYGIIWWTTDKNAPITQALRDALQVTGIPNRPHFVSDLGSDAAIRVGLKIPSDH